MDILKTQLILKAIVTEEEFNVMKSDMAVDFIQDSHFAELKESELLRERLGTLREIDEYVGRYYSVDWVRKNVLQQREDEIEDIIKTIEDEGSAETEEEV